MNSPTILLPLLLAWTTPHASQDTTLSWTVRERLRIGGADDQQLVLSRVLPQDVAADGRGRLYLYDRAETTVIVLDGRGRLVRRLGRSGGGPGEFQFPTAIGVAPDGAVWVADAGKGAIVRFDSSGADLPELPSRGLRLIQRLVPVAVDAAVVSATGADSVQLAHVTLAGSVRLHSAPLPLKRPVDWSSCGLMRHETEPLLSPRFAWGSNGHVTAYSEGAAAAVAILDRQDRTRRYERPGRPTPSSLAAVRAYLGDSITILVGRTPCSIAIDRVAAEAGVAPVIPAYSSVLVAPNDEIWAIRHTPLGARSAADIYSVSGGYLGTVTLGKGRPVAFLSTGEVVSIDSDESDVPMIVVSEVLRR